MESGLFFWFLVGFVFVFVFVFLLFRAALVTYGSSRARGQFGATAASLPQPQQCTILAMSVTYPTAYGNAKSLTHQARPEIKPASSWMLVRFVNHWAMMGTPGKIKKKTKTKQKQKIIPNPGPKHTHGLIGSSFSLLAPIFHLVLKIWGFFLLWTPSFLISTLSLESTLIPRLSANSAT